MKHSKQFLFLQYIISDDITIETKYIFFFLIFCETDQHNATLHRTNNQVVLQTKVDFSLTVSSLSKLSISSGKA